MGERAARKWEGKIEKHTHEQRKRVMERECERDREKSQFSSSVEKGEK